jgi:50S ribosomal subunit-associated GTPase HflX
VLNKIDLLPPEERQRLQGDPSVVAISAQDPRAAAPLLSALQGAL